jgi:hypothetical protein
VQKLLISARSKGFQRVLSINENSEICNGLFRTWWKWLTDACRNQKCWAGREKEQEFTGLSLIDKTQCLFLIFESVDFINPLLMMLLVLKL